MIFRYRFVKNVKLLTKKYIFKIIWTVVILSIIWTIYRLWIISKFENLNDMSISMANELDHALTKNPITDEYKDTWKVPSIKESRIFTAYFESRPEVVLNENMNLFFGSSAWALIRIIAILPLNLANSQLTCYLKYKNEKKDSSQSNNYYIHMKKAEKISPIAFKENFGMYYTAAYILCPLPFPDELDKSSFQLPFEVTASVEANRDVNLIDDSEFVVIRYPKHGFKTNNHQFNLTNDKSKFFSICVQPLHHKFDKAIELISFIEYYRLMGVTKFVFYRDSVKPVIDKIFDYYKSKNLVVILEWNLPDFYVFERTLRVDGIYAALNDCLYRNTFYYGYKYVIGVDIDEYIVPRMHDDFFDLMGYLDGADGENDNLTGAWIFRNVFYYLMYDDDPVTFPPGVPKLDVLRKTRRWEETNPRNDRSKFIVRGQKVVELGNHRIWEMMRLFSVLGSRYQEVEVDPKIGTSNHYRNCETVIEKCWQRKTIVDRTTHRFTRELSENVAAVHKKIFGG